MNDVPNDDRKRASRSLLSLADDRVRDDTEKLFSRSRSPDRADRAPRHGNTTNPLLTALSRDHRDEAAIRSARIANEMKQRSPAINTVSQESVSQEVRPARERTRLRPPSAREEGQSDRKESHHRASNARTEDRPAEDPQTHDTPPPRRAEIRRQTQPIDDVQAWRPMFDPATVLAGITRSKAIIIAMTILGGVIGVGVALSTPKEYEAVAELLVDPRDLKLVDRELTQTGLPFGATLAIVENQVKILTSRSVVARVVDELNLDRDPEFNGSFETGFGQAFSLLKSIVSPEDPASTERMRNALAAEKLYKSLEVQRGGKTFVVSVSMRTQNPDKSALIANKVVEVFLKTQGDFQNNTATRASDELNSRLAELRSRVERAERKVEAFKAQNDLVDTQGRLITDDTIVRLNNQLSNARAQTITLNAKAQSARSLNVGQIVGGSLPEQVNSGVLAELRGQFASLKQEATRLAVKLGPRHPQLAEVEAQVEGARQEIQSELRRIVSSIQVELKRAVQQEQELASKLAQLKSAQANVSEELVTLRELEREAAAQRAVYESYLLRAREADEQKDINTANVSLISEAMPPLDPSGISRKIIAVAGTLLGFGAGVGIGFLRGAAESLKQDRQPVPKRPISPTKRSGLFGGRRKSADAMDRVDGDSPAAHDPTFETDSDAVAKAAAAIASVDAVKAKLNQRPETGAPITTPDEQEAARAMNADRPSQSPIAEQAPSEQPMAPQWQHPAPNPAPPVHMNAAAYPPAQMIPQPVAVQPSWQQPVQHVYPSHQLYAAPQGYGYPPVMQPQPIYHVPMQPMTCPMQPAAQYPAAHMLYPAAQMQPAMVAAPMFDPRTLAHNTNHPGAGQNGGQPTPAEEIRDSLREFRDAVRTFSQDRAARRY